MNQTQTQASDTLTLFGEDKTCCSYSTGPSPHGTGHGLGGRLYAGPVSLAHLQPPHRTVTPNRPLPVQPGPYPPRDRPSRGLSIPPGLAGLRTGRSSGHCLTSPTCKDSQEEWGRGAGDMDAALAPGR